MGKRLNALLILAFVVGTAANLWYLSGAIGARYERSGNPFDNPYASLHAADRIKREAVRFEIVLVAGIAVVWVVASTFAKAKN